MESRQTLRCAMCGRAVPVPQGAIAEDTVTNAFWFGDLYITCAGVKTEYVPDELRLAMLNPKLGLIAEEYRTAIAEAFQKTTS